VSPDQADLIVTALLDDEQLAAVNAGIPTLVLVRSVDAISSGLGLARPAVVRRRRPGDATLQYERPWDGDWSSVFAWATPGIVPGLPEGGLLGDAHAEIFPDLVLDGIDVAAPENGVDVGLFSGWVHSPAALLCSFRHGAGTLTLTTLRVAPEDGPVASAMLAELVDRACLTADSKTPASNRPHVPST
jgi:hypothetical protein